MFADPDDSLSLLVAWDAPVETHGADITSYSVELKYSASAWGAAEETIVDISAEDAAAIAATASVGGEFQRQLKTGIERAHYKFLTLTLTLKP